MAYLGRETYQMQNGFVPDVLRDPYIRVALPPPPPRVRMPPSPEDDSPTPPGSPISIHSSDRVLQTGSIPPTRRLTNEYAMPFLKDPDLRLPPIHHPAPWLWHNLDQGLDQYSDQRFDQNSGPSTEAAEMVPYPMLGDDQPWLSPPWLPAFPLFPGTRLMGQFASTMFQETPRHREQRDRRAWPSHWRRKKRPSRRQKPPQTAQAFQDAASKTESKTKTEDNVEEGEEDIEPYWRIPVKRRIRSQSLSAVEDGASARSYELPDNESMWEQRSARSSRISAIGTSASTCNQCVYT